jgi:hypothetical protein
MKRSRRRETAHEGTKLWPLALGNSLYATSIVACCGAFLTSTGKIGRSEDACIREKRENQREQIL